MAKLSGHFLVIGNSPPYPDKASGDLRFFSILTLLKSFGEVTLVLRDFAAWREKTSEAPRYEALLKDAGITLHTGDVYSALLVHRYDFVWFEFYHPATEFMDVTRRVAWQTPIVIDSVDVHYKRLEAQADLSQDPADHAVARDVKAKELETYASADVVVAVSAEDRATLQAALPNVIVPVLPNVHEMHPRPSRASREYGRLIFVGGFRHPPNGDAMTYFVSEVLPIIRAQEPSAHLTIVGSAPSEAILALAGPGVEVLGYVPDTAPYLQSAYISVAPLRFGAGMKGKVGEALSHGLPVVTTSFGAEGFGLTPGKHLLVADSKETFAEAVVRLMRDPELYDTLSEAGYRFIADNYSTDAMKSSLDRFLEQVHDVVPKRVSVGKRLANHARAVFDRTIGWRIR